MGNISAESIKTIISFLIMGNYTEVISDLQWEIRRLTEIKDKFKARCRELKKENEELKRKDSIKATISWYKEDIKSLGYKCTDEEAEEVLTLIEEQHDASVGVNWEVLESWCEYVGLEKEDES